MKEVEKTVQMRGSPKSEADDEEEQKVDLTPDPSDLLLHE